MLTGQAKKDYQRGYMRDYMRNRRGVKTPLRPVKTPVRPSKFVKTSIQIEENPIVDVQPKLYNPMEHKIGDKVLVKRGKRLIETVIPELDADGYPIPE